MSLFITSLNSGSNGNCYYIGSENEAVLIDAGISCRETETRMKRLGLSIGKVKAIFVSHEHSDHIKGLETLSKKYRLPVYISEKTLSGCHNIKLEKHLIIFFNAYENITFGGLSVIPFPKFHDAIDPYSFIVDCNKVKAGIFTDIGSACKHVIQNFKQCHAVFLEANYDDAMLNKGNYPYHLKKRISGGFGHLSNNKALQLFIKHKPVFMSHLFLSHLSKNNNCPELAKDLFSAYADGVEIIVASRYTETEVYHIQHSGKLRNSRRTVATASHQLSFSFY